MERFQRSGRLLAVEECAAAEGAAFGWRGEEGGEIACGVETVDIG